VRLPDRATPLAGTLLSLAAGAALVVGPVPSPWTVVAAAALALWLPGYGVTSALFPGDRLAAAERLAMSLALSFAIAVAAGFALHLSPVGLTSGAWGVVLGIAACAACLVAVCRAPARSDDRADVWRRRRDAAGSSQLSVYAAAGLVAVLAVMVARTGVGIQPHPGFSELWAVPAADGTAVTVGVANHEGAEQRFRLSVTLDGEAVGDATLLTLADDGAREWDVVLPTSRPVLQLVEVRLWRADAARDAEPYRTVSVAIRGAVAREAPSAEDGNGIPAAANPSVGHAPRDRARPDRGP
jgi:uncharacterized membrane protein